MKNLLPLLIFILVLVAAVILLIVFAGGGKYSSNAPDLTVIYDGVSKKAGVGTHSWHTPDGGGYESHSSSIFSRTKPAFELSDEKTVTLKFQAQPDKISIKYWPADFLGTDEMHHDAYRQMGTAINVYGNTFTLPEGDGFVFEVTARWNEGTLRKAYGSVPFSFIIR